MDSSAASEMRSSEDDRVHVGLTHSQLDIPSTLDKVRHPSAGAVVMFAGTTRDNFQGKPVSHLAYSAYVPLALQTMQTIAADVRVKHQLVAICMVHRLGEVPIGEDSILICVSAPHRTAAWRAGEEALERCKEKVEIWKLEEFSGDEPGVWRANRDGAPGEWIEDSSRDSSER